MNALEQKLVESLLSNKYKQITGQLRTPEGHCCLGVACDISGLGHWNPNYTSEYITAGDGRPDSDESVLPRTVRLALGWSMESGLVAVRDRDGLMPSLADLNDIGFTFPQIADLITAGLIETIDEFRKRTQQIGWDY